MKPESITPIFRSTPHPRFNFGAWSNDNKISLLGREVYTSAPYGEPDIGKLLLVELENGKPTLEKIVWQPEGKEILLEDARAMVLPNNELSIGLTAVKKENGIWLPYPAYLTCPKSFDKLAPANVIYSFGPGKDTTPIEPNIFIFRPESHEYNHKFLVFDLNGQNIKKVCDIELPKDFPWAQYRFGTTFPPIWVSETKALFIVHGITLLDGIYIYSISNGILEKKNGSYFATIDPVPFITPDSVSELKVEEFHPEGRRVVYCCGAILKDNKLSLFINIGDNATYELSYPFDKLI